MRTVIQIDPTLNSNQKKAVLKTEGPLLIIAGPGSGKTKTLVERVVYLVSKGIDPTHIMIATFTEKAAMELITRVSNRLLQLKIDINLHEMYIGTLHSIFLRILEENREFTRLKRNYRVLDDFDQKYFLFRNLDEYLKVENHDLLLGNEHTSKWEIVKNLVYYMSKVNEECLNVSKLLKAKEKAIRALGEMFRIYERHLFEENALDFSTIQTEVLHLLQNNKPIVKSLREKLTYLMIDEYQDTNTIQEKILFLLTGANHNICVVGDDDQSLYRFRGATVRNILEFPSYFPKGKCSVIKLEVNYRSHPDIINFYNKWIDELDWTEGKRQFRYSKTIKPQDKKFVKNPSVIKVSHDGDIEQYFKEVLRFIKTCKNEKVLTDYNQIAFLFRSVKNDKVLALANYLEENGINVFSPRSALFFEREEIQLLLGALIFMFPNLFEDLKWNDKAHLDVWDSYEFWKVKFAKTLRENKEVNKDLLKYCQKKAKEHLILRKNTDYAFTVIIYQLLEFPMFSKFLNVDLNDNKVSLRSAYNIALLTKLLFKFEYIYNISVLSSKHIKKHLRNLFNFYLRYIYEGGIEEYEDFDEYAPSGCVSFMTIHQSKGLEFPIVFVGSLNAVPMKQYDDVDEILINKYYSKKPFEPIKRIKFFDFWRLYYTAFSRAQNLLVLTSNEKQGRGRNPSKYFQEIYNGVISWKDRKFRIDKLQLESIKSVNIKKEYSFTSHILLYENCPMQYKFYKELEFVEVRTGGVLGGSLLHQTIEDIHKAVLRNEVNTLTNVNITDWFNSNYYLLSKSQRSYLHQGQLDSLLKQILRYRDRQSKNWHLIREAEVDVSLVKEDYILKGKIDLIEGENGTVELVDFKSGDKPDVNSSDEAIQKRLAQYRRQLEVYAHIVEERTGQAVSKMHLYYPKEEDGSPYISFKSNKDNIQYTVSVFDEVVKNIEKKDYSMNKTIKSEKLCGDCDMRFHCNPKQYND